LIGRTKVTPMVCAKELAAVAVLVALLEPAASQTQASPAQRELIVGVKDAPPFALKDADGTWQGISIDLWRRVADVSHLPYRFEEAGTVQELIDGVAARKFDVAVAALSITAARERVITFTQPFFQSGLGIAVPTSSTPSWMPVVHAMTSYGFLYAVAGLVGLALVAGCLLWLFERRHNEDFSGSFTKGISSSVWWSTAAMTQKGLSGYRPVTLPGRTVAILWMVVSIVAIAVFTAGITSALTIKQMRGSVHGAGDLASVRVGTVAGTATETTLARMHIGYRDYKNVHDGIRALENGKLDAFVYDRPILAWNIHRDYSGSVELLDVSFEPQTYGLALADGSPLRKTLDVALLDAVQSDWWRMTLFRYLGTKANI
jgi:ABC-type amino acid transport substrate-binding protein